MIGKVRQTRRKRRGVQKRAVTRGQRGGVNENPIALKPINAVILDQASTQTLQLKIPPGGSILTNQNTMMYMEGSLTTSAKVSGIWNAIRRGIAGQSVLSNLVTNSGDAEAEILLAPSLPGAVVELTIRPGESWKIFPGSFLAGTANLRLTGSLDLFNNFTASFVGGNLTYTVLEVPKGGVDGRAWIYGFGGVKEHSIRPSVTPFILNNGSFLAMPSVAADGTDYWKRYITVGTPQGLLNAFLTAVGFVIKVRDDGKGAAPLIPIYTQTLNIENFKGFVREIARTEALAVRSGSSHSIHQIQSSAVPTAAMAGVGAGGLMGVAAEPAMETYAPTDAVEGVSAVADAGSSFGNIVGSFGNAAAAAGSFGNAAEAAGDVMSATTEES